MSDKFKKVSNVEDILIYAQVDGELHQVVNLPVDKELNEKYGEERLNKIRRRISKIVYQLLLEQMGFGVKTVSLEEIREDPERIKDTQTLTFSQDREALIESLDEEEE